MAPGGVLLRENRMYGCENSVHKEPGFVAKKVSKKKVSSLILKHVSTIFEHIQKILWLEVP